jgi:transketolase
MNTTDQLCVNTIRFLSVDAVEKARSGHPGMPLGAAPMAYVLWDRFLRHNPHNPKWFDRDRFVLSAGHGSMLIYSLLHLYGYDLPMQELKNFRQWGSRTAGHPEYGLAPGVECTTGPLGQGFAMGVGMAMAEAHLAAAFNEPGTRPLVDHHTYAIVSDGDLMEGVACEAASLAGTLGLGKLIYLYDDNRITIEGSTDLAFTEDVGERFVACGWHVQTVEDGNDLEGIERAIRAAQAESARPSLIRVRTHIGYGSPRQDSEKSHGEPLGSDNARATKEKLEWPLEPDFYVPEEVAVHCAAAVEKGANLETAWNAQLDAYRQEHPGRAALLDALIAGDLPEGWEADVPVFDESDGSAATRSVSGKVLNAIAARMPTMIGGSADLGGSNKSELDGLDDFGIDGPHGRNIHYGVREHAMAAIVNGMALHGGVVPYGATFLIFSDYMRPALRLAALMNVPSRFIFTHDSIGLGEDGPTHQPVEQLMSLRLIPRFTLFRPADANETAAAWKLSLERPGPSAFALTRQNLPVLADQHRVAEGVRRGGYVLSEAPGGTPSVVLLATGSEVSLALEAREKLAGRGVEARVVSMPSWEVWREQDADYRGDVLPAGTPVLVVEAGATHGWRDIIGDNGTVIGLDRFGESAPGPVAMEKLGFNVENVVTHAERLASGTGAAMRAGGGAASE